MCLPAAIALASSAGRICVVAVSKNTASFLSASAASRSVVTRVMPLALASWLSFSLLRPTRMGSGMTRSPFESVTPPWARMATIERATCWFVPMRPVTPFMTMPSRRTLMHILPVLPARPVTDRPSMVSIETARRDTDLFPSSLFSGERARARQEAGSGVFGRSSPWPSFRCRKRQRGEGGLGLHQSPHVADGTRRAGRAVGLVDERLDRGHAGISALGQGAQDGREGERALAGAAAVGIIEMHVGKNARGQPGAQQLRDRLRLGA